MSFPASEFGRRVAVVAVTVVVVGLLSAVAVLAADLLPLLFGALLVALFLRGLRDVLCSKTRLDAKSSLAVVVLLLTTIFAAALIGLAPAVIEQAEQLVASLPRFAENAEQAIASVAGGEELLQHLSSANENGQVFGQAVDVLALSVNGLIALVVVIVGGLYLAIDADLYRRGFARLFPVPLRPRTHEVLLTMGDTIQRFLLGRVISMVAVGVATGVTLALLGLPLAVILGLIAGVLTFVPYAGPIVASLPIGLVAITEGPKQLAYALLVYTIIQAIEGFVITPVVQKRAVHLPPVVTLAAEIVMGMVFGAVGVIISVPLAAAVLVVVRMLWVEDVLERPYAPSKTSPA